MELILTGVGEFFKLWCTRKSQGAGKEEGGAEPLYHLVLSPLCHHTGESLFTFFMPYWHTLIVSRPIYLNYHPWILKEHSDSSTF